MDVVQQLLSGAAGFRVYTFGIGNLWNFSRQQEGERRRRSPECVHERGVHKKSQGLNIY